MSVNTNDNKKCEFALQELKQVIDPEIGLNVVDLGLIYTINFNEIDMTIYAEFSLTTQFCPMGDSIQNSIEEVLITSFPNYKTTLHLTFNPAWNQNMITEQGKIFLNKN